jgi:hypothetical protein
MAEKEEEGEENERVRMRDDDAESGVLSRDVKHKK